MFFSDNFIDMITPIDMPTNAINRQTAKLNLIPSKLVKQGVLFDMQLISIPLSLFQTMPKYKTNYVDHFRA